MVSLYRAVSRYNNQYLGKLEPVTYPRKNHEVIMMKQPLIKVLILSSALFSISANAWTLDVENSEVNFVSIKKGNIGETHIFTDIAGTIEESTANIVIRPDSVDSRVPIRDERMREFLFETGIYPIISISSDVTEIMSGLSAGTSKLTNFSASLSMHGVSKDLTLDVRVSMLSDSSIVVSSSKPFLLRAADFNMVEGIQKLASLVNNLPIAESVPVSFSLSFTK